MLTLGTKERQNPFHTLARLMVLSRSVFIWNTNPVQREEKEKLWWCTEKVK